MPKQIINGNTLSWEEAGTRTGLPVVLLHPFPLHQGVWAEQRQSLGRKALADHAHLQTRVITPDLRGFGRSSLGQTTITMDLLAADVCALLDALRLDTVVLGGLSLGGYVALAFYHNYPERVRGLVLANTKHQADTPEQRRVRQALITVAKNKGAGTVASLLVPKLFGAHTFDNNPALPLFITRQIEATAPASIVAASLAMADRQDSTDLLPKIHCPTLIITGEQDTLTPPALAHEMAAQIPQATVRILPQAGHLSNLEQPAVFNQVLTEYVAQFAREKS